MPVSYVVMHMFVMI